MGVRLVLLSLVLVLPWGPIAQVEVLVQPSFDAQKFSGLWYVVAMASDCKAFPGEKDHLLMSTRIVNATEGGNLSVQVQVPRADSCSQVDAQYLKVGSDGHFRVPALGYMDVRIASTDYDSFAILYISKELGGAPCTAVQLYSRTRDPSPQALKAFQDFYPTVGLLGHAMAELPRPDVCAPQGTEPPDSSEAPPLSPGGAQG